MALNFQAFVDGRSGAPDGDFVLGGYIAPAETGAQFSKDWEEILPLGTRAKNGKFHFKMSEMARSDAGLERAEVFYRVIEKYDLVPIACRLNLQDFAEEKRRLVALAAQWNAYGDFSSWSNPYYFSFRMMMDRFHDQKAEAKDIPLDEKVDFIFDDQTEKSYILASWDAILAARSEESVERYGSTPRFENDQEFLPLQAADFWAWWVRDGMRKIPHRSPINCGHLISVSGKGKSNRLKSCFITMKNGWLRSLKGYFSLAFQVRRAGCRRSRNPPLQRTT